MLLLYFKNIILRYSAQHITHPSYRKQTINSRNFPRARQKLSTLLLPLLRFVIIRHKHTSSMQCLRQSVLSPCRVGHTGATTVPDVDPRPDSYPIRPGKTCVGLANEQCPLDENTKRLLFLGLTENKSRDSKPATISLDTL